MPDRPVSDADRLQVQRRSCLIRASRKPQVGNVYDMLTTRRLWKSIVRFQAKLFGQEAINIH